MFASDTMNRERLRNQSRDGAEPKPKAAAKRRRRLIPTLAFLTVLAVTGGFLARGILFPPTQEVQVALTPPTVTVSAPLKHRMATWTSFTGQFSAMDRVEIRAQVSGYLTEIHFKDGQIVKKGDLLFVIDPRPYEIALANAKAQVETARATLDLSGKQLNRTSSLLRSDYASKETFDQRTQAQQAAAASLDQAKATVRNAELNMEWTHIVAPMSGRISRHLVSVGNLVTGGLGGGGQTTMLTTIVSLDPIYLDFDMGEGDYVAYQRFLHQPHAKDVDHTVQFALSDETGWKHRGKLDFLDNEMDRSSGTIRARATIPNRDLFIAAGEFARLRLPTAAPADLMLLPESALSTDQSRTLVMTVGSDGSVVPKAVEVGVQVGDMRVIKAGLKPDDRVVINGLMFARPGSKVTPQQRTTVAPLEEG